jgi:hypothetical protein
MVRVGLSGACHRWVVLVIALFMTSIAAGVAQAADGIGQAVKVRGEAVVERSGSAQPLKAGSPLQLRDVIRTGAKARVQIQFSDGSVVTLGENSGLSIDRYSVKPGASRNVLLTALDGIVNTAATKSGEALFDYQVKTADGYSAVRGTVWITAVGPAGTTFATVEGQVQVGVGTGNRVVVSAGNAVEISKTKGMSDVQPLAPDLQKQLLDATDVASANAAPDAAESAPAAPANPTETAPTDDAPAESAPAPSKKSGGSGGGGGGGGGGGHGM